MRAQTGRARKAHFGTTGEVSSFFEKKKKIFRSRVGRSTFKKKNLISHFHSKVQLGSPAAEDARRPRPDVAQGAPCGSDALVF